MRFYYVYLIWLAVTVVVLSGCDRKEIDFKLPPTDPRVTVDCRITDSVGYWEAKLTLTQGYLKQVRNPPVEGATVVITDDAGNRVNLIDRGQGVYRSADLQQGIPGRTYNLSVTYQSKLYEATTKMTSAPVVDSFKCNLIDDNFGFVEEDKIWEVTFWTWEAPTLGDYYLAEYRRNGEKITSFQGEIIYEDRFVNGNYIDGKNFFNIDKINIGDIITIDFFSITKAEYDFLNAVNTETNRDGTPFDSPPGNPVTNISNGGLGFFSASGVARLSTVAVEP